MCWMTIETLFCYNYKDFALGLTIVFSPILPKKEATRGLFKLKQGNCRVKDLIIDFHTMAADCKWTEETLRDVFWQAPVTKLSVSPWPTTIIKGTGGFGNQDRSEAVRMTKWGEAASQNLSGLYPKHVNNYQDSLALPIFTDNLFLTTVPWLPLYMLLLPLKIISNGMMVLIQHFSIWNNCLHIIPL